MVWSLWFTCPQFLKYLKKQWMPFLSFTNQTTLNFGILLLPYKPFGMYLLKWSFPLDRNWLVIKLETTQKFWCGWERSFDTEINFWRDTKRMQTWEVIFLSVKRLTLLWRLSSSLIFGQLTSKQDSSLCLVLLFSVKRQTLDVVRMIWQEHTWFPIIKSIKNWLIHRRSWLLDEQLFKRELWLFSGKLNTWLKDVVKPGKTVSTAGKLWPVI